MLLAFKEPSPFFLIMSIAASIISSFVIFTLGGIIHLLNNICYISTAILSQEFEYVNREIKNPSPILAREVIIW